MVVHKLFPIFLFGVLKVSGDGADDMLNTIGTEYEHRMGRIFLPPVPFSPVSSEKILDEYDFIVVGSGSAGAALAARLSENPKWNILLLEVGKQPSLVTDIPAMAAVFQLTDYNWGYLMEKQDNMCLGMVDQRMAWPRGRALGGTTIINYMIHVRGNKLDYDRWAAAGNPGWSYADVLPYFKKLEDCTVSYSDAEFRSRGGPISVEDVPYRTESVHAYIRAAQEVGHKYVDYNGKDQMGVSYVQSTTRNSRRCSTEACYLRDARKRPNLTLLLESRATKLILDDNKKVLGVQFVKNKRYHMVKAKKEVILSAGTFNTPQLLMLSGIGPKNHLSELGIPVVKNLPVGEMMYDHLTFLGLMFTVNETITISEASLYEVSNLLDYLRFGKGPHSTLGGVESLLYLQTNVSRDAEAYPDMELIFLGGGMHTDNGNVYRKTFRIKDEVYNVLWKPLENKQAFSVLPMLVHPYSKGRLRLKSKNPYHWPKLYGNSFTDPENLDIKTFIAAVRETQRIVRSPALQRYAATQVKTPVPGCEQRTFDTDEYWECALRTITGTLHHQVSTCKMGPAADPEAVVDHKLKVYGIKGLRVADCSVIPLPLTAHTNVPAIMIGEKAADLIKSEWSDVGRNSEFDPRRNVA